MTDFKPSRATVTVVGSVGSVQSKFDGKQTEVSIAVGKGYKKDGAWVDTGTDWYTFITRGDWQATVQDLNLQSGDRVEVTDAKLEHRTYEKNDGTLGIACDLNYGEIAVLERKADRAAAGGGAPSGFGGSENTGF